MFQVSSPVVRETASLRNDDFRYFPLLSLADQQVRSSRLPIRQYSRRLALTDDPQKRPISISFDSLLFNVQLIQLFLHSSSHFQSWLLDPELRNYSSKQLAH